MDTKDQTEEWKVEAVTDFIFLGSKVTVDGDCSYEIKRRLLLGRKPMTNRLLKSRDATLPTKVHIVKAMVFLVVMYGCESWTIKKVEALNNWCFQTVVLQKTLECPLDIKEIKPVNPKGDQPELIGRTDAEAEGPILWPSEMKSLMLRKIEGRMRRGWKDEMVGWHHWLHGHEFEQTPGDSEGQGSLACCSPWGHK